MATTIARGSSDPRAEDEHAGLLARVARSSAVSTAAIVLLFLGLWRAYIAVFDVSPFLLPTPEATAMALFDQVTSRSVWERHIWTTFYETISGLGLAILVGVPVGVMIGKSARLERISRPFVVASQVVPKVALVPLFILWFGFGSTSKVLLAALIAFFPLMTNTAFGIRSVPEGLRDLMASMGVSRWQRFKKLDFHHTLAYTLASMEVAVVLATIGAIVGEYLGGDRGLGRYVINLQTQLLIPELFGAIVLTTCFGFVLYSSVSLLRRLAIPWHESVRAAGDQVP